MNLFAFVAWLERNRHAHSEDRLTIDDGYEWYNYMWNIWLKNSDAGRGMMMNKKTFEQINQDNPVTRGSTALVYKQETLEEAAKNIIPDRSTSGWIDSFGATERIGFTKGAKWQAERMYSEEEVYEILAQFVNDAPTITKEWFEQFKKK